MLVLKILGAICITGATTLYARGLVSELTCRINALKALRNSFSVRKEFPEFDVRVSILGHLQRGGRPSARDRILASRTGCGAIEAIMQGQRNVMIGVRNNEVVYVPLSEAIRSDKQSYPPHLSSLSGEAYVPLR